MTPLNAGERCGVWRFSRFPDVRWFSAGIEAKTMAENTGFFSPIQWGNGTRKIPNQTGRSWGVLETMKSQARWAHFSALEGQLPKPSGSLEATRRVAEVCPNQSSIKTEPQTRLKRSLGSLVISNSILFWRGRTKLIIHFSVAWLCQLNGFDRTHSFLRSSRYVRLVSLPLWPRLLVGYFFGPKKVYLMKVIGGVDYPFVDWLLEIYWLVVFRHPSIYEFGCWDELPMIFTESWCEECQTAPLKRGWFLRLWDDTPIFVIHLNGIFHEINHPAMGGSSPISGKLYLNLAYWHTTNHNTYPLVN